MSKGRFLFVATTCWLVATASAWAQQPLVIRAQGQPIVGQDPQTALPSPSDLRVDPFVDDATPEVEVESGTVEEVSIPEAELKTRQVTVNLVLTETKPTTAVFRRKTGEVLAEQTYLGVPKLQFEIAISSPYTEDVKVLLPVPKESDVYHAFVEYGEKEPQRVLEYLAKIHEPVVSVVALNKPVKREKWHDASLVECSLCNHWRPLYEVWLEEANMELPELVAVPRADCFLYDLTKSTINNSVFPENIERLFFLSGEPERFSPRSRAPFEGMPVDEIPEEVAPLPPIGAAG